MFLTRAQCWSTRVISEGTVVHVLLIFKLENIIVALLLPPSIVEFRGRTITVSYTVKTS